MNRADVKQSLAEVGVVVGLVAAVVAMRFLPHPVNFSPVLAIMIFAGSVLTNRYLSFLVPLAGVLVSDLIIGIYEGMAFVYLAYALTILMGRFVPSRKAWPIVAASTFSSVLFFVLSNLGVWIFSTMYDKTLEGLWLCYLMALPFFHYTFASTVIGSVVLFGVFGATYRFVLAPRH